MSKAIDNEELRKMIQEYPDLPLVFMVNNDEICFDYGCTVFEGCRCKIGTVYIDDDQTYDCVEDAIETYSDIYCDDEKYEDLNDKDFYEAMKEYVNENIRHYEAIIVYI